MFTLCLIGALLSVGFSATLAASPGRTLVVRRFRHGRALRRLLVVGYGILGVLLVIHAIWAPETHVAREVALTVMLLALLATIGLLLHSRIHHQDVAAPRRVLAIGAHPDDLELACGATLATLVDRGHEVHAIVMTAGSVGGDAGTRPDEARAGASFLGLKSIEVNDLPDTQLEQVPNQMIKRIEAAINRVQPHIILTHSVHDQHQDHHAVHLATLRAARHHHSILCYESPSVTRDFNPGVFIEVDDYTDVKVEAIAAHRDQAGKPYMTAQVVKGITAFRGRQAKRTHAEGFEAVRLLATETGVF